MQPNIYSPSTQLPFDEADERGSAQHSIVVTDEQLLLYNDAYFDGYWSTVDEFFPQFAPILPIYAHRPFHTTIVRMRQFGVVVAHRRSDTTKVEVRQVSEFMSPGGSLNIYDVIGALKAEHCWFNALPSQYSAAEGRLRGVQDSLSGLLDVFWQAMPNGQLFEEICRKLIKAEGVHIDGESSGAGDGPGLKVDLVGKVVLQEPAGFRRVETWGFKFKHISAGRVSAGYMHEMEQAVLGIESLDVVCIVTPDDLTNLGRYISVESPRLRVWDRVVLDRLVNRHLDVLRSYFDAYPNAVETLTKRLLERPTGESRADEFAARLSACPPGNSTFDTYESLGSEILSYVFGDKLGPARPQSRTVDGKQRRDVLFRNNRTSSFFDRVFHRYDADVLIVDCKNYSGEIEPDVVTDVEKYANKALGRFILVISRKGAAKAAIEAQLRTFRDTGRIVLIVSDSDLMEMIYRKERGLAPEDVLEDKLDDLLTGY